MFFNIQCIREHKKSLLHYDSLIALIGINKENPFLLKFRYFVI